MTRAVPANGGVAWLLVTVACEKGPFNDQPISYMCVYKDLNSERHFGAQRQHGVSCCISLLSLLVNTFAHATQYFTHFFFLPIHVNNSTWVRPA